MKGMPNMGQIMKQAQKFQSKMGKLQEELGEKTVEASAGGGMVSVVANGKQELISIKIERNTALFTLLIITGLITIQVIPSVLMKNIHHQRRTHDEAHLFGRYTQF